MFAPAVVFVVFALACFYGARGYARLRNRKLEWQDILLGCICFLMGSGLLLFLATSHNQRLWGGGGTIVRRVYGIIC